MRRSLEQPVDPLPERPTRRQQAFLDRHKLNPDRPLDFYEASHAIGQFVRDRRRMSPTASQESFLKQRGKWKDGMNRGEAFDLIRRITAGMEPSP